MRLEVIHMCSMPTVRQEVLFGTDLLVDECASRQRGALRLLDRRKSNDDKTGHRE
jgi:hypothetical protein